MLAGAAGALFELLEYLYRAGGGPHEGLLRIVLAHDRAGMARTLRGDR